MISTPPQLDAPSVVFGATQHEVIPITGALVTNPGLPTAPGKNYNTVVYAFELSDKEKQQIIDGADLYLSLVTFGGPPQPCLLTVGKERAAAIYNVKTAP